MRKLLALLALFMISMSPALAGDVGTYIRPDLTTSAPSSPVTGQTWIFNSTDHNIYVWDGTEYVITGAAAGDDRYAPISLTTATQAAHSFYKTGDAASAPAFGLITVNDIPIVPTAKGGLGVSLPGTYDRLLVGAGGQYGEIPAPTGPGQLLHTKGSWTGTLGAGDFEWYNNTSGTVTNAAQYQIGIYDSSATNIVGSSLFTFNSGVLSIGTAGSHDGTIIQGGSTGSQVTVSAPTGTNHTAWVYPSDNGDTNRVLACLGSGYTTWGYSGTIPWLNRGFNLTGDPGRGYGFDTSGGALAFTLPDATTQPGIVSIVTLRVAGHDLTVGCQGSQTILSTAGSTTTITISTQYETHMFVSDGANWIKVF